MTLSSCRDWNISNYTIPPDSSFCDTYIFMAAKKKKKKGVMDQFGASSLRTIRFSSSIVILSRIFLLVLYDVFIELYLRLPNFFHDDVHSICRRHNVGLLYTPNNLRVRFLLLKFNGQKGFLK